MSRRDFLKQIGLAAVAMGVSPVSHAAKSFRSSKTNLKIGLLLPENKGYPLLADHYLTGFKSKLLSGNQGGKLTGMHADYYRISSSNFKRKVESMLSESDVDIVVAHASFNLISDVEELFHQHEKILVASVLGESVGASLPATPFIYINSLNLWQSNWMAGQWAAEQTGGKAAIVNSFYDAGFDSCNTFKIGFETSGGQETKIFMFDPPGEKITPMSVINEIEQFAPNVIFVNLSGIEATLFLKTFLGSDMNGKAELVASPLALTEQALPHIGSGCCGIKSVFTWSPVLENRANSEFISILQHKMVVQPDVFHLLGYETAMILLEAEKNSGVLSFNTRSFASCLENMRMESPRGMVTMNSEKHITSSPYYLREVNTLKFKLANRVLSDQVVVIDEYEETIHREYSGLTSGWINPYLTT